MNKKLLTTMLLSSSLISFSAISDTTLTGSEILAVTRGGVPNKVYKNNKPTLKIATYNIGKNETSDDVKNFEQLIQAIKNIDADVISVTEIDNNTARSGKINQLETLAKANNLHFQFGKALDFDGGEYGVGVLSKYPIDKAQVINLPSGQAEQRVVLLTQISKPGFDSPIIVMTTHLDWQKDPTVRTNQVRHILDVAIGDASSEFDNIASSIKVLAGDFNSTVNEQPITELKFFWNLVNKKDSDVRSWPAINPALDIDHIFTFRGQKWNVKTFTIPQDSSTFTWSAASDHLPVIAELELLEQ